MSLSAAGSGSPEPGAAAPSPVPASPAAAAASCQLHRAALFTSSRITSLPFSIRPDSAAARFRLRCATGMLKRSSTV